MALPDPAPVLIVDDDDLVRGILLNRLERMHIPVIGAASAEEALAKIEIMRIGALVLDLQMPGQSGLVLAEFVRLFGAHMTGVPILIFTGTTLTEETLDLARRVNADVYQKPDGLHALLQRLTVVADPAQQKLRMERMVSGAGPSNAAGGTPTDYTEPES
jgi:two-component system, NtrC family, C4-dicarboxylate transport response regulator DctD